MKDTISRVAVTAMLTCGLLLPLIKLFDLDAGLVPALLIALVTLGLLFAASLGRAWRIAVFSLTAALAVAQLFLPSMGALGGAFEAVKALLLRFSGLDAALALFAVQTAALLSVTVSLLSFAFSKRGAGFVPSAIVLVMVMFAIWSMGRAELLWYTLPALVALLLILAQNAHDHMNVFHALPMALVAVLAAFLLLPSGRVTIPFMEKAASQLKETITDYLFFTEPRNVFTLASYGYYPLGGGRLGGEAQPSEYPVMTVKTDRKTLLRAVIKDEYTGRGFRDTSSARRYLYINPRWAAMRKSVFLEDMPPQAIRRAGTLLDEKAVTVQMQNNGASTLFSPLFPRSLSTGSDMVAYFNDASELFITRDLESGDRYTVFAPVLEGGDAGLDALVNACLKDESAYAEVYSAYTQLPSHLEQKVFSDVFDIVKNAQTPYQKAVAIMRHLQRYYRYTLSPEAPPENLDFVTYFLYVGREGYCTYYAAAMTVMCRMAGLPARYVEGFCARPASDGFAYVTGKDAHAWTEVYFEGFGWVPFDPTPSQNDENSTEPPQTGDGQRNPEPSPEPSPSPSPEPDSDDQPPENPDQPENTPEPDAAQEPQPEQPEGDASSTDPASSLPFILAALILALLIAAAARIYLRMPDRMAARAESAGDKVFVYGAAVYTMLAQSGRRPKPGETLMRFARRMDGIKAVKEPISPITRVMSLSNYGRRKPGAPQVDKARQTCAALLKSLPPLKKLRFLLAAGFIKACYRLLDTQLPRPAAAKPAKKRVKRIKRGKRA